MLLQITEYWDIKDNDLTLRQVIAMRINQLYIINAIVPLIYEEGILTKALIIETSTR